MCCPIFFDHMCDVPSQLLNYRLQFFISGHLFFIQTVKTHQNTDFYQNPAEQPSCWIRGGILQNTSNTLVLICRGPESCCDFWDKRYLFPSWLVVVWAQILENNHTILDATTLPWRSTRVKNLYPVWCFCFCFFSFRLELTSAPRERERSWATSWPPWGRPPPRRSEVLLNKTVFLFQYKNSDSSPVCPVFFVFF